MASSEPEQRVAGLVGRERACAVIDRLLDRAQSGESGSLMLRGEAGSGKTALLRYAASRAVGKTVLSVTGVEAESDLDFAGLHSLVRPIVGLLPQLPGPQREALAASLGLTAAAGSDRFLVSAGVLSLLAEAAEERPLLCVVDDAQWLDTPSADALVFTARRLGAEGIVVLFAVRDGEPRRFDAPGLDELVLGGLDHRSARTLLDRRNREVAPSVRERLLADAAGNPLALLELPTGLTDDQLTGRTTLPDSIPLPARLQAAFRQRIERLPKPTQAALLLAAADEASELAIVLRASPALELPLDALDAAERAGLIETQEGRISFRHPLVRSAVYKSATSGERRRAHAALADACSGDQHANRRLWHRAVATLTTDEDLAAQLEASAERSQRRGGHASAATAFERAAQLSETEASRARRLSRAAYAAYVAGQVERASDLVSRSLPIADQPERARLLGLRGVIDGYAGLLEDAVTTLLQGIAVSEDVSLRLQMLLEACGMATYLADYEQLRRLCDRASGYSPITDADRFVVTLLAGAAAELDGDYTHAEELTAHATEIAARLDDAHCLIWASAAAGRAGIWGDGLPYANRAVRVARERALVSTLPYALQAQASQLLGQSRFDLGYSAAQEGWTLAQDLGLPSMASWTLADLATTDAVRGDEAQARAHIAELQAISTSTASMVRAAIARALGMLDLGLGRPSDALEQLLASVDSVRPESNPMVVLGVPDAIEAAQRSQRLQDVTDHFDRFEKWIERFPNRARLALLARSRALMEESDAERHHAQAVQLADALSPFDRARSELLYGEWLRRNRRRIDARRAPPRRPGRLRAARRTALGRPCALRTARKRGNRAQTQSVHTRSAHTSGAQHRGARGSWAHERRDRSTTLPEPANN